MSNTLKYLKVNLIVLGFLICSYLSEFIFRKPGKHMLFVAIFYCVVFVVLLISNLISLKNSIKLGIFIYVFCSILIFAIFSDFYETFIYQILIFGIINFITTYKLLNN